MAKKNDFLGGDKGEAKGQDTQPDYLGADVPSTLDAKTGLAENARFSIDAPPSTPKRG